MKLISFPSSLRPFVPEIMLKEKDKDVPYLPIHRFAGQHYTRLMTQKQGLLIRVIAVILGLLFLYLLFGRSGNAPATKQPKQPERNDAVDLAWNERSNWRRDQKEEIASRRSIYTTDMFKTETLKTNGLRPVTAIMLSWKRPEGLKNVVQFLGRYPFIKEILIWNNNKKARLNVRVCPFLMNVFCC